MFDRLTDTAPTGTAPTGTAKTLTPVKREEIVRRYWMKGDLTPLAVANSLAGQKVPEAA